MPRLVLCHQFYETFSAFSSELTTLFEVRPESQLLETPLILPFVLYFFVVVGAGTAQDRCLMAGRCLTEHHTKVQMML